MSENTFFKQLLGVAHQSLKNVLGIVGPSVNLQCLKVTKDHADIPSLITRRMRARVNELQSSGISKATLDNIMRKDLLFLDQFHRHMQILGTKQQIDDLWLFFDSYIQQSSFFELRRCDKGSEIGYSSIMIHLDQ